MTDVFSPAQLTGRDATHVVPLPGTTFLVHRDVVAPFLALQAAAAAEGIDLQPVSAFRDFERQCRIWNDKCRGLRPVLDREERPVDLAALGTDARIDAVLLWSALPGASRHHWGTDLDVIDAAALSPGYAVQLTAAEFAPQGPFARLDAWLSRHAADHGFHRPYASDRGGVQPEPWHISHATLATRALQGLTVDVLESALRSVDLAARAEVLARLPELHARYVLNVEPVGGPTPPSTPS